MLYGIWWIYFRLHVPIFPQSTWKRFYFPPHSSTSRSLLLFFFFLFCCSSPTGQNPNQMLLIHSFSVRNQVGYFQRHMYTTEIGGRSPIEFFCVRFFGSTLNLTWFLIPTGSERFPSVVCFGITYKAANPSALFSCSWNTSRAALQCWNNPWRTHLFIKPLESLCEKCLLLIFSPLLLLALASLDADNALRARNTCNMSLQPEFLECYNNASPSRCKISTRYKM